MNADPLSSPSSSLSGHAVVPVSLCVSPNTPIRDAIARMGETKDSCVLITQQQRPIGIFTERDLVRLIASEETISGRPISSVMTQPVKTIHMADVQDTFSLFQQMQHQKIRHLPVVDVDEQLVGMITRRSLRKSLTPSTLLKLKLVEDVMETSVVCGPITMTVKALAQKMAKHNVSCIIILAADTRPIGIVTERDIVQFQALGLAVNRLQAQTVMSTPLLPVHPKDSLWQTHQQMNQRHVRRFVVCTSQGELAGLITQSSLLQALNPAEVQQMIELLQQEVEQLRSENQTLLEARNQALELEKISLNAELEAEQVGHQQADEQIRFQARLLDAVAQSVIAIDLENRVLYWNRYSETLYGWSEKEVVGHSVTEAALSATVLGQVSRVMPLLKRGETWSGELVTYRQDGTELPVWASCSPIYDARKALVGFVSISTNISDRKRIEAERAQAQLDLQDAYTKLDDINTDLETRVAARTSELNQAERRWRTLLEDVQLAVVGIDREGIVTYANDFFLNRTNYTFEEAIGSNWTRQFIPASERNNIRDYIQRLYHHSNTLLQHQNPVLTKLGEERIIAWNNTLLRDSQGHIVGIMGIGEDITESFALERMKGEFIAMVSHELRTPLTSIHGGIKLLSQNIVPSDSEQGRRLLEVAATSSERLVRLVEDILELEKLESGKSLLRKEFMHTHTLTHQVLDSLKPIAESKNITLEAIDPGVQLMADSDRLSQVLTNLLDNAIKFSPDNATVALEIEQTATSQKNSSQGADSTIIFSVRDQGIGIPPEQQAKIFERFMQADHDNENEKGGTGLGLTICRNIVEQHGGRLWVESTVGEGSCFYFTLPVRYQLDNGAH